MPSYPPSKTPNSNRLPRVPISQRLAASQLNSNHTSKSAPASRHSVQRSSPSNRNIPSRNQQDDDFQQLPPSPLIAQLAAYKAEQEREEAAARAKSSESLPASSAHDPKRDGFNINGIPIRPAPPKKRKHHHDQHRRSQDSIESQGPAKDDPQNRHSNHYEYADDPPRKLTLLEKFCKLFRKASPVRISPAPYHPRLRGSIASLGSLGGVTLNARGSIISLESIGSAESIDSQGHIIPRTKRPIGKLKPRKLFQSGNPDHPHTRPEILELYKPSPSPDPTHEKLHPVPHHSLVARPGRASAENIYTGVNYSVLFAIAPHPGDPFVDPWKPGDKLPTHKFKRKFSPPTGRRYRGFRYKRKVGRPEREKLPFKKDLKHRGKRFSRLVGCGGGGPLIFNPCRCLWLRVEDGGQVVAAASLVMYLLSIPLHWMRFPADDELELILTMTHVGLCGFTMPFCILLVYAIRRYKILPCIPWVIGQFLLLLTGAFLMWESTTRPIELYPDTTDLSVNPEKEEGDNTTEFSSHPNPIRAASPLGLFCLALFGFLFGLYFLWVILAYIYSVCKGRISAEIGDPYSQDPHRFIVLPNFSMDATKLEPVQFMKTQQIREETGEILRIRSQRFQRPAPKPVESVVEDPKSPDKTTPT